MGYVSHCHCEPDVVEAWQFACLPSIPELIGNPVFFSCHSVLGTESILLVILNPPLKNYRRLKREESSTPVLSPVWILIFEFVSYSGFRILSILLNLLSPPPAVRYYLDTGIIGSIGIICSIRPPQADW